MGGWGGALNGPTMSEARDGSREGKAVINGHVIFRLSLMARLLLYIRHPSHLKGGHPPQQHEFTKHVLSR